jgi:tetratricopeptide (TPR) repeat protein
MAAGVVVGIWSLSPVQTNAVTYIVQRMTSLSALFCFLTFSMYFTGRRILWQGRRLMAVIWWSMSGITFLLALMSKENSAMLPVLILVAELIFQPYGFSGFAAWNRRYKILTIIGVIIVAPIILLAAWQFLPSVLSSYDHRHFTLHERLLTESRVVVGYVFLLLLPLPSRLCLDSHVVLSNSLWSPPTTFFSLAGLLLFGTLIVVWWHRRPLLSFSLLWFFLNLVIESTIVPLELRFEHRLYLPSAGFYLFLIVLLMEFGGSVVKKLDRRLIISFVVVLLSGLSLMTFTRNQVWVDPVAFNSDCVAKAPEKPRVYNNLCKAYIMAGNYQKGIENAEKAIALGVYGYEEYWAASCNLMASLEKLGRKKEALERGQKLLVDAPGGTKKNALPAFLCNLADLETEYGEYSLSYEHLRQALDLLERSTISLHQLVAKRFEELFSKVISEGDDGLLKEFGISSRGKAAARLRVAELYLEFYDFARARKYLGLALAVDPECKECDKFRLKLDLIDKANSRQKKYGTLKENYVYRFWTSRFNFWMACAYLIEKFSLPFDGLAADCLFRALRLKPSSPDPLLLDSWRYFRRGDYDNATRIIDKAIRLTPEYAQLWVNKGMYQLAAGQTGAARQSLLRALSLYPGYPKRVQVTAMLLETTREEKHEISVDEEDGDDVH